MIKKVGITGTILPNGIDKVNNMSFGLICIDKDNTFKRINGRVIYKDCGLEEEMLINNQLHHYFNNRVVLSLKQSDTMKDNIKIKSSNIVYDIPTLFQSVGNEDLILDFQIRRVSQSLSVLFNKEVEMELETTDKVLLFLKEGQVSFVPLLEGYTEEQLFLLNNMFFCDEDEIGLDKGFYEYYKDFNNMKNTFIPIVEVVGVEDETPLKVFVSDKGKSFTIV